jgi:hypothetical protein
MVFRYALWLTGAIRRRGPVVSPEFAGVLAINEKLLSAGQWDGRWHDAAVRHKARIKLVADAIAMCGLLVLPMIGEPRRGFGLAIIHGPCFLKQSLQ